MPAYDQCPKTFMGAILTGKRQFLFKSDVPVLSAPKWPELGLKAVWTRVSGDRILMSYFPPMESKSSKLPPRDFFWGVLQSLRPEYCETLIAEAAAKRSELQDTFVAGNSILNIGITK